MADGDRGLLDLPVRYIMGVVRRTERGFGSPDDEWASHLCLLRGDGGVVQHSVPGIDFEVAENRVEFFGSLVPRIEDEGAVGLAFLRDTWVVPYPSKTGTEEEGREIIASSIPPNMDPDRIEVLTIWGLSGETSELWITGVFRDGGPPRHGQWQGPFSDPIDSDGVLESLQEALRREGGP